MKINISGLILIPVVFLIFSTDCRKKEIPPELLTDVEGNSYKTVTIGDQVWMSENLKTSKFNDGSEIPLISDPGSWENLSSPGFCWYNNDEATNKDKFGALYNGFAVSSGKLCPVGWSVPGKEDFKYLMNFLGDSLRAGGKLKETGFVHWLSPNKGALNSSGFTAFGAGIRYFEGTFSSLLMYTSLWSSTELGNDENWYMGLYFADASLTINNKNKRNGFSIRCLKN